MNYAQKLESIVPAPDRQTTDAWLISIRGNQSHDNPEERHRCAEALIHTFAYISNCFSPQTAQQLYETKAGVLIGELLTAAVCLEAGVEAGEILRLAADGEFEGGDVARQGWETGRLALITVQSGRTATSYLCYEHRGEDPAHALADARRAAGERHVARPQGAGATLSILPECVLPEQLLALMGQSTAVACCVHHDVGTGRTQVAHNPRLVHRQLDRENPA